MLTFESVKQRLERESPLSFLEFNYMILQVHRGCLRLGLGVWPLGGSIRAWHPLLQDGVVQGPF